MNILLILKKKSKWFYVYLLTLGMINSVFFSIMLTLINKVINKEPLPVPPRYQLLLFFLLLLTTYCIRRLFQTHMIKLTNNLLFEFEMTLLEKLRFAGYENFEKLGKEKVYTAIGDTRILAQIPEIVMNLFNSAVIVICCLIYMFSVSFLGGSGVTVLMILLLVMYLVRNKKIEQELNKVRDLQNDYYRYLKDFLFGFKEIKMSDKRNNTIFNKYLKQNRDTSRSIGIETGIRYMNNELSGFMSWYVVLGIILFVLPGSFHFQSGQLSSFVITTLYLMGPVSSIILFIPTATRIKIATERIRFLENEVNMKIKESSVDELLNGALVNFQDIRFNNVVYEYQQDGPEEVFILGPLNFEVRRGEVVFITGGNGSGKSTFVKLLTGLYRPSDGEIYFNNEKIVDKYRFYNNQFSAIFTDNYLFLDNYNEFDLKTSNKRFNEYIRKMQLESILEVDNNNRIKTNLSKGQQKRLAMIYALMEEKQVLVLDEWAAEQDPSFRKYFYTKFLAELKDAGKTIIAITHDDAYFHCADRVVKFAKGKLAG